VPGIQLHFGMAMVDDHSRNHHLGARFSCHICLLCPKSRGNVSLAGADPMQPHAIDPNFFAPPSACLEGW
jgi:choline dehydrogenase-like flavoprotein